MSLIELPFSLPGRVFRSPMPFGPYDLHGAIYERFCEEQIAVIVLLASDAECLHKTGCNLRALYLKAGFQVLYLPIPDFSVPTRDDLEQAVQHTIAYAQAGQNIVVHCSAGIGRTGLFMAYLAKRCPGFLRSKRLSSGYGTISPVLWKHLSNNGSYSMTMSLQQLRAEGRREKRDKHKWSAPIVTVVYLYAAGNSCSPEGR